jgi:hypothetical protein
LPSQLAKTGAANSAVAKAAARRPQLPVLNIPPHSFSV